MSCEVSFKKMDIEDKTSIVALMESKLPLFESYVAAHREARFIRARLSGLPVATVEEPSPPSPSPPPLPPPLPPPSMSPYSGDLPIAAKVFLMALYGMYLPYAASVGIRFGLNKDEGKGAWSIITGDLSAIKKLFSTGLEAWGGDTSQGMKG